MNLDIWNQKEQRQCLPLARGDESHAGGRYWLTKWFALRKRGWITATYGETPIWGVCPSQEGMNHVGAVRSVSSGYLPLAGGDESDYAWLYDWYEMSAPRKRWWICKKRFNGVDIDGLPLARGDESHGCCGYIFRSSPASRMRGWIARGYLWPEKYTVQLSASRKRGCFYFC